MRSHNPLKVNSLLLCASLFAAAVLGEVYLRLNPPVSLYMDTRNIVQHTHSVLSPHSYIGYIPAPNQRKRFSNREFTTTVITNSKNMRDREFSESKPAGITRIAAFGDSFVFGWGVENHETASKVLESSMPGKIEVLNFGVSGYAAYQALERLKQEGLAYQPDIVLFFCYGFPEGYLPGGTGDSFILNHGLLFRERPAPPIEDLRQEVATIARKSHLYRLIRQGVSLLSEKIHPSSQDNFLSAEELEKERKNGFNLIRELKSLGESHHFTPVVIWIPTKDTFKTAGDLELKLLEDYCRDEKIHFLDLTAPLYDFYKKHHKSPYFRIDDHWNIHGHKTAASAIRQYLLEKNLIREA